MHSLLTHCYCHPLRWTTALCMVPNLEYNTRMTMSRDNTSSSISFFSYARADAVIESPPCLAICSSFAIRSFSGIRKRTLKLVAFAYTLVASTKATGCFLTFDVITLSFMNACDKWSFGKFFLCACRIFFCSSSNDGLYTSINWKSSMRTRSPHFLSTGTNTRGGWD